MTTTTRHIGVRVERPMPEVYAFAADPLNLPRWASGLAGATVEHLGGDTWFTESPLGRITFTFAPRNELGVLDHDVVLPSGQVVHNPLRVLRDGDASEVVFTLRQADLSDEELESDAATVAADLATLKSLVEAR